MIIDCHTHIIHPDFRTTSKELPSSEEVIKRHIYSFKGIEPVLRMASPENLLESMESSGIDKSAIMGFSWKNSEYCEKENDYIALCCKKYPDKFYGIAVIQPLEEAHWKSTLERVENDSHFVGVKLIPFWQGFSIESLALEPFLKALEGSRLFLMVHSDQGYQSTGRDNPGKLYEAMATNRKVKWIGAHLGGMLPIYHQLPHVQEALKHVWYDTALSLTPKFIQYSAESTLPHQLLFGTDYPFNNFVFQKDFLKNFLDLNIEPSLQNRILSDNFLQLIQR